MQAGYPLQYQMQRTFLSGKAGCTLGARHKEAHVMTHGREFDRQGIYQIRVKGILEEKWSDWFDGFTLTPQVGDETLMTGPVADQAALHGLLSKIRDLGLPLLSVKRVESGE